MPNNFESFSNNETYNAEQPAPQVSEELTHKFGATAYAGYREAEGAMENGTSDTPSEDMDMMFQEKVVETPEIPQQEAQEDPTVAVLHELEGVEWHEHPTQNTNVASETTESHIGNGEEEATHESLVRRILEKAKNSRAFKAAVVVGLAATMAFSLAACGANKDANQALGQSTSEFVEQTESTTLSGEQPNGVFYNYSHYADREGKESANAYDYDMSDCYGDEEAFKTRFMEVAASTPEAMSTYTIIFTDEERQELGLKQDDGVIKIDDIMSNDVSGGDLQKRLLNGLNKVLNDKENTRFTFYLENDYETSSYMYFVDQNDDGIMAPPEMHIGKAYVKRSGAPQVNIERKVSTAGGSTVWVTMADINLRCGGQINGRPEDFPDVPVIDPDDPTPTPETSTTPTEPTEWGKEGDPHGGPDVTPSDKVDPNSEVSKEQNDNANKGNQGYIDDGHAAPGSGSENNGTNSSGYASSNIVAPGANTDGERLSGGENQGGDSTNGENAYYSSESISQGQQVDNSGNASQAAAQAAGGENGSGASAGGDNYSDSGEEAAVENGDF